MRQFQLTKWCFLVHSTTRNAPYLHPILELRRTFPNVINAEDLGKAQMNEFIAKCMKSIDVRF